MQTSTKIRVTRRTAYFFIYLGPLSEAYLVISNAVTVSHARTTHFLLFWIFVSSQYCSTCFQLDYNLRQQTFVNLSLCWTTWHQWNFYAGISRAFEPRSVCADPIQYASKADQCQWLCWTPVWRMDRRLNFGIHWDFPTDVDLKPGIWRGGQGTGGEEVSMKFSAF